jgi:hypothetical protein
VGSLPKGPAGPERSSAIQVIPSQSNQMETLPKPVRPGGETTTLLSKLADAPCGGHGSACARSRIRHQTNDSFPLAPVGERGARKAGGEGVFTKMEFVWEGRKSKAKGKSETASASPAFHWALAFLTPSPGLPRLMKTPVAVHPLPQGGEGSVFPWSPLETGCLDRQRENDPQLPRIASACAAPHSQPDAIYFGHE